jgi:hypothetical protein
MKTLLFIFPVILILFSSNSYSQWQTYQTPSISTFYWDVSVVNQNIIWVCGTNASVRRTTNGGLTWDSANYGLTPLRPYHRSAIDQNRAWITGGNNGERVFCTTNGGLNWNEQLYTQPYWINGIHFFNSNTGVFIRDPLNPGQGNDTAGFFITRNGGLNWYRSPKTPRTTVLCDGCMNVLDTNLVWFVDGEILYKLQGGLNNQWQLLFIAQGSYCYGAVFKDPNSGLASDGITLYRTTNGGLNWYLSMSGVIGTPCLGFIHVPNVNWVIINGDNKIRISHDFGTTWQPAVTLPVSDSFSTKYADASDTNSIWIAAAKGRLLKYNFDYIGISGNSNQVPKEFVLYQNYPNPFNPNTLIRYDLPVQGEVEFRVYDVLGRDVYSLREFKNAGSYEIAFDGSALSSGLYYYRVEIRNFTEIKKMILLK